MKEIKLNNSDLVVLVDDDKYEYLNSFSWRLDKAGYAFASIRMHQLVKQREDKENVIDHINNNKLDNQESNLRECTQQQNMYNKSPHKNSKSKYKGVERLESGKYRVFIKIGKRNLFVGNFEEENVAAYAYDQVAKYFYGDFAYLNFPCTLKEIVDIQEILNKKDNMTSRYYGVSFHKKSGKYAAIVQGNHLGLYETELMAAVDREKYIIENKIFHKNLKRNFDSIPDVKVVKKEYSSKYIGVYYVERLNKWSCQYVQNGKTNNLGLFDDEISAVNFRELHLVKNNLVTPMRKLNFPEKLNEYKKELGIE